MLHHILALAVALALLAAPALSTLNRAAANHNGGALAGGLTGGVVGSGSKGQSGGGALAGGLNGGVVGSGSMG